MTFAPEVDPNQEIGWILCVILSGSQLGNRVDPLVGNWVAPISGNFAQRTSRKVGHVCQLLCIRKYFRSCEGSELRVRWSFSA